jgi:hypothetical protein
MSDVRVNRAANEMGAKLPGRNSCNARRELDGRYARVRGSLKLASPRHLIGVWVKEQTIRLKRLGSTFEDIARELTLAGLSWNSRLWSGRDQGPARSAPVRRGVSCRLSDHETGCWRGVSSGNPRVCRPRSQRASPTRRRSAGDDVHGRRCRSAPRPSLRNAAQRSRTM